MKNTSISHNCISDSFCLFNKSHSVFVNSSFNYNSCGPILKSLLSEIELFKCNFSNNISPSNLISINSGKIIINSSTWVNSTTAYGSSISTSKATLLISNSVFNNSYSRICGASIHASQTEFESIENSFINSKSLQKGLSICFTDCLEKPFKIDQTSFYNSQNEKFFTIYLDKCTGAIKNSLFNRTIDDEIPILLHNNCINCSFQKNDKNSANVSDYATVLDSDDNNLYLITKVLLIFMLVLSIILLFFFRRNIRICFRRMTRKHHI